jgi:hypothetical protein
MNTHDSIKILMLAESGHYPSPIHIKYVKLVQFLQQIVKDWECDPNDAKEILKQIEEI